MSLLVHERRDVSLGVQVRDDALIEPNPRPLAAGLRRRVEDGPSANVLDLQTHLGAAATDLLVLVRKNLDDLSIELHHRPALEVTGRNHAFGSPATVI